MDVEGSTLTGRKRSRPDEESRRGGEVEGSDDFTNDLKRQKHTHHEKGEDGDDNDDQKTVDMNVDIANDNRTATNPLEGGGGGFGERSGIPVIVKQTQVYSRVSDVPNVHGPTSRTSTTAKVPVGFSGSNGLGGMNPAVFPGYKAASRPSIVSMKSSAMNDAMNGRGSDGDPCSTTMANESSVSSTRNDLSQVQIKLNTRFSFKKQKPSQSTSYNASDSILRPGRGVSPPSKIVDPAISRQDVVLSKNIHKPERITTTIRMKIKTPPSKTLLFFAMSIMFLLNVFTTYLILALHFLPPNTVGERDPLLQMQLMVAILSNIVATRGLSIWITPRHSFQTKRHHPHIIPPSHGEYADDDSYSHIQHKHRRDIDKLSNVTLRQFLSHEDGFHLALAPSFFGFYVYFGALTAFQENVLSQEDKNKGMRLLPVGLQNFPNGNNGTRGGDNNGNGRIRWKENDPLLKSVAGASAGAMAAVLLASGLDPRDSAEFASSMTLDKFADFPGFGGVLKGDLFEKIMVQRLKRARSTLNSERGDANSSEFDDEAEDESAGQNVQLEEGLIPVAVTGFDILSMQEKVLTTGCMGKAARASATFPGLFQPCHWRIQSDSESDQIKSETSRHLLIDGGIRDPHGLVGLQELWPEEGNKRIVNLVAGKFGGWHGAVGPSQLPDGISASEVVSISIENAPQCGPWAMNNGPRAVNASMNALNDVLDAQMYHGNEEGHYILRIDAKKFIPDQ